MLSWLYLRHGDMPGVPGIVSGLQLVIAALVYFGLSRWRWPVVAVVVGAVAVGAAAPSVIPLAT